MASIEAAMAMGYAQYAIDGSPHFPANAAECVTMGLLDEEPQCPQGGGYVAGPSPGTVACPNGHSRGY